MKVVFRVDASIEIGTGHVMRCLTLANALAERSHKCSFVCRAHKGHLIDLIRSHGHDVYVLPLVDSAQTTELQDDDYAVWLVADWQTDAEQTLLALVGLKIDWLVVDHYALDANWEKLLRPLCNQLMVIDDLANRHHDCDLLLDQNLNRDSSDYLELIAEKCDLLIGPYYALLKPEYSKLRDSSLSRIKRLSIKRLLISMGGVDKNNVTGKLLGLINQCDLPADFQITVVMGQHAPYLKDVTKQVIEMKQVEILVSVENMAELILNNDFAIGAAGTSAWERCCLGLPTITLVLAENQRAGAEALSKAGAVLLLKDDESLRSELNKQLKLLQKPQKLTEMQKAAFSICDGKGVIRVMEKMTYANS